MEDSTPERQATSLLDGEPSAGGGAFPAIQDVTPEQKQAKKVNSRGDLDLDVDQFADCDDFEEAVLNMTIWLRENELFVEWNPFQVLMKEMSELYDDSAPDRKDKDLSRILLRLRTHVNEYAYGRMWRRGIISPAENRLKEYEYIEGLSLIHI